MSRVTQIFDLYGRAKREQIALDQITTDWVRGYYPRVSNIVATNLVTSVKTRLNRDAEKLFSIAKKLRSRR